MVRLFINCVYITKLLKTNSWTYHRFDEKSLVGNNISYKICLLYTISNPYWANTLFVVKKVFVEVVNSRVWVKRREFYIWSKMAITCQGKNVKTPIWGRRPKTAISHPIKGASERGRRLRRGWLAKRAEVSPSSLWYYEGHYKQNRTLFTDVHQQCSYRFRNHLKAWWQNNLSPFCWRWYENSCESIHRMFLLFVQH